METSSSPRSAARSRFSKALPAPPPLDKQHDSIILGSPPFLPARKDSLPSPSPLSSSSSSLSSSFSSSAPIVRKAIPIPSNMAARMMDTPLPPLPSLARVNTPPTVVPKRKPVGSGTSLRSQPSPPPTKPLGGDISPVESINSLLSAYGEEDVSEARHSVETAATKYSTFEPSPPKVLPKDHLGGGITKLDLVSPLALPTPLSSHMSPNHHHLLLHHHYQQEVGGRREQPPTPPIKDTQRPTTPKSARTLTQRPVDLADNNLPLEQSSRQSPSQPQPQLLRRRSLKSDKPLTLPELKLTSSHGSTSSSQQVISSLNNDLPDLPKPKPPFAAKTGLGSPMSNGVGPFPGRHIRPSPSQKALPHHPHPQDMGNKSSKEPLDGFSQYAQEIENNNLKDATKTPQYSPAKMSPELRRPPTPEYSTHDTPSGQPDVVSPVSPMTPPEEPRPLSVIGEDVGPSTSPAAAMIPIATTLSGLPPRSSSRPGALPSGNKTGLPRSPRMNGGSSPGSNAASGASLLTPSPAIQPALASPHARSISDTSVPTIEISDDGASTIKAPNSPPRPVTSAAHSTVGWRQQQTTMDMENGDLIQASKGEPNYFPMAHYKLQAITPGTVLTPAPLKPNQLDCFANHYRFTPSKNEDHPLACQSCQVKDHGVRFTCAHCRVRICMDCRDVLMMNGRDLNKLVEMLKA